MKSNFIELFEGLSTGAIPFDGKGYIINTGFDPRSAYTKMEIIAFKNVKNILSGESSVTFHSDGWKIYIVFEPSTYQYRFQEPFLREGKAHVPMRWNELDIVELSTKDRVFVSHEPFMSFGAFTVDRPEQGDFVYYFFETEKLLSTIDNFLSNILHKDCRVPKSSIPEILGHVHRNLEVFNKAE
jgi:hypothetical protein